jgi:two-component system response regulator DevR
VSVRVFLLDDHEIVRRGLRELLEDNEMTVVGEAGTAEEALAGIGAARPDVAVLDINLPDGNGIEVCRDVRSAHPEVRCLMLTAFGGDEALYSSVLAGASGYVLKKIDGGELVASIRKVAAGQSLIDGDLMSRFMERVRREGEEEARMGRLTDQERRILDLLAEGMTNRQIGERLFLAEKTVKNYVSNILSKLGFSRRTEAALFAARLADREHRPEP